MARRNLAEERMASLAVILEQLAVMNWTPGGHKDAAKYIIHTCTYSRQSEAGKGDYAKYWRRCMTAMIDACEEIAKADGMTERLYMGLITAMPAEAQ